MRSKAAAAAILARRPRYRVAGRCLAAALAGAVVVGAAQAQPTREASEPQSAIPWLSESLSKPPVADSDAPLPRPTIVTPTTPQTPAVSVVQGLAGPDLDAVGLIPAAVAGVPVTLWQGGDSDRTLGLLRRLAPSPLPGVQDLVFRLSLSEAAPPAREDDALLLARIDVLMARGALDGAQALIERAGPAAPGLFRRWFDIALLTGTEDRACAALIDAPHLAPSPAARVMCLARTGRWMTAAITLDSLAALGDVSAAETALLARFLDPDDDARPLPPPGALPSPLEVRLYEAVGNPLDLSELPLAYAWADLRFVAGWEAQLAAAERLARAGALPGNRLLGLYTLREATAAGPLWDRARAIQALDAALNAADPAGVATALDRAHAAMTAAGLEATLARIVAPRLAQALMVSPESAALALRLRLLDGQQPDANGPLDDALADALALRAGTAPTSGVALGEALGAALDGPPVPLTDGIGEAVVAALTLLTPGAGTGPEDWAAALATLRDAGLDEDARRIAADIVLAGGVGG